MRIPWGHKGRKVLFARTSDLQNIFPELIQEALWGSGSERHSVALNWVTWVATWEVWRASGLQDLTKWSHGVDTGLCAGGCELSKGRGPCVFRSQNCRPSGFPTSQPPCLPPELLRWGRMGSRCFTLMKWRISKCYLRKHMVCPSKRPPSAAAATNTFLYSAQTSPRGIRNNCGDKSACR